MKNLKIAITLLLVSLKGFSQDVIKFKNSDNPKSEYAQIVKIIYVDDTYLYFYQTEDATKTIKIANLQYLSEFQYNSIELGKNRKTIESDSLLFIDYARKNRLVLHNPLKWDRPFSIDLITTKRGEKIKAKILNKTDSLVTYVLVLENYITDLNSKQTIQESNISSIVLNSPYFRFENLSNNLTLEKGSPNTTINTNNYRYSTQIKLNKTPIVLSSLLFITSGIFSILANNTTLPDPNKPNYNVNLDNTLKKIDKLQKVANYSLLGGGMFLFGATLNF